MDELKADIRGLARQNEDFRREVITGPHSQVVLMSIEPGSEIGEEVHDDVDQVLVFVEGTGEAVLEGGTSGVEPGDLVFVPAGTRHNFLNRGDTALKLYTVYSPPEHPAGTVHHSKEEADAAEHH
ncbi:MAG TPA: cupin domain-containing protein [Acidimicrobiales bacterium]|nr:cupin domain-containing protein [Acidimicrobiales bacterium]